MNEKTTMLTDEQRILVEQNLGVARWVAWKYYRAYAQYGMDWDDVYSTACMGLMHAVRTFDPQKSKNTSYLLHACRHSLLTVERKQSAKSRSAFETVHLQDACARNQRGEELRIEDILPSNEPTPEETMITCDTIAEIRHILRSIDDKRGKCALALRMNGLSQEAIAKRLGLSQTYVSKILSRMRTRITRGIAS